MRFEERELKPYAATADDEAVFETGAEKHTFEYERALDVLLLCALRRRKSPNKE